MHERGFLSTQKLSKVPPGIRRRSCCAKHTISYYIARPYQQHYKPHSSGRAGNRIVSSDVNGELSLAKPAELLKGAGGDICISVG